MTHSLPSLNALRAFEALARHLHYPSAAAELNVSPAAVKQLVGRLESSIGVKLVERRGRGLALTRRGLAGQQDLAAAMQLLAGAVDKMRGPDRAARLIVSAEASLATAWLVPRLADFRSRHPQINVLIDSSQEVVDLRRGDVDVAIRYGVATEPDQVAHRLFADRIFPACSPALAAGPPALRQLGDLRRVPLIHWDLSRLTWATATRQWFNWQSWLSQVGGDAMATDDGLYFSDYGLAVQAAIAGQGVLLASWPILQDTLDAGLLVQPFGECVSTDIGYDVVATERVLQRDEVMLFVAWILEISAPTRLL